MAVVVLHTTEGDLPVLLYYRECPKACFNFLALCASDYYDDCRFYRHMPGILLQSGDPTNTGKGGESVFVHVPPAADKLEESAVGSSFASGPQRYFEDEGFGGATQHKKRGTLSMAHKGPKANTNASQFFISLQPQSGFDNVYTCFGEILLQQAYQPPSNPGECAVGSLMGEKDANSGIPTGEAVLSALERAAADVDEKKLVRNEKVKIMSTTVLYNPFAEGKMSL